MIKSIRTAVIAAGLMTTIAAPASAGLISSTINSYTGPNNVVNAVAGTNSGIIAAPSSVADLSPGIEAPFMVGFNERQNVSLSGPISIVNLDYGRIYNGTAAGTTGSLSPEMVLVRSHMLLLNPNTPMPLPTPVGPHTTTTTVTWTFDSPILAVIFDQDGTLLGQTDYLGNPLTAYTDTNNWAGVNPASRRGFEPNSADAVSFVDSFTVQVTMKSNQPGDWLRVLTLGEYREIGPNGQDVDVPEPATLALFGTALIALGAYRRRRENA